MVIVNKDRLVEYGDPKKEGAPKFLKTHITPLELMEGAGRLFSAIDVPAGSQIPEHFHHGEYEVYFMTKGEGDYNDNGTIVHVKAGDVMVCPDGEKHGLVNNSDAELSFIAFIGFPNEAHK